MTMYVCIWYICVWCMYMSIVYMYLDSYVCMLYIFVYMYGLCVHLCLYVGIWHVCMWYVFRSCMYVLCFCIYMWQCPCFWVCMTVCVVCVCICMSGLYLRYYLCWSKLCFINRVAKQIWFWRDNFGQLLLCGIFSEQKVECTGVSYSKLLYTEVEIESRILSQNITFDSQFLCKFSTRERLMSQLNEKGVWVSWARTEAES